MEGLRGIESFIKAVQAGSIAAGARQMGISPAAASQNISRLEEQLGARLLKRTTRSLSLTESGEVYFDKVQALLQELELANQAVSAVNNQPRGKLRVASTRAFARHMIAPVLPSLTGLYPELSIELIATDRNVDHVKESVDVSIRSKQALEPGLVARPLARVPSVFCASPDYIARCGMPTEPEQLKDHDCLLFRFPVDGRFMQWGFSRAGKSFYAQVRASMISDDIDSLTAMAVAGGGITRLGAFIAEPLINSGKLVQLFAPNKNNKVQAEVDPLEFFLCVSDRYQLTPKVEVLYRYLREQMPAAWLG